MSTFETFHGWSLKGPSETSIVISETGELFDRDVWDVCGYPVFFCLRRLKVLQIRLVSRVSFYMCLAYKIDTYKRIFSPTPSRADFESWSNTVIREFGRADGAMPNEGARPRGDQASNVFKCCHVFWEQVNPIFQ